MPTGASQALPDDEAGPEEGHVHAEPDHLSLCGVRGAAEQSLPQQTQGGLGYAHHPPDWTRGGCGLLEGNYVLGLRASFMCIHLHFHPQS